MSNKYRNTPHKNTVMTFEKLETAPEVKPEPGEITPIEEPEVKTVPSPGDSRIRKLVFLDKKEEYHVEVFVSGEWTLLGALPNFKEAQERIDKWRSARIVTNEILPY